MFWPAGRCGVLHKSKPYRARKGCLCMTMAVVRDSIRGGIATTRDTEAKFTLCVYELEAPMIFEGCVCSWGSYTNTIAWVAGMCITSLSWPLAIQE